MDDEYVTRVRLVVGMEIDLDILEYKNQTVRRISVIKLFRVLVDDHTLYILSIY